MIFDTPLLDDLDEELNDKEIQLTEQDKVGKLGEKLILKHYNSITDENGNKYHARATRLDEQLQGADLMVFNQTP